MDTIQLSRKLKGFFDYFYEIPHAVPGWDLQELRAISNCILNGQVISGPHTKRLEEKIKGILGVPYVLSVNSGRSAIEVALRTLGLKRGDEVIVPSFCCMAAVLPIARTGCDPVFADVDETCNMDPEKLRGLISSKTRAILVPHLFGRPARIDEICKLAEEYSLFVIDDAAQSFGATLYGKPVGISGDLGILSFGPGKTLVATGGGLLVTNKESIFLKAKAMFFPQQVYSTKLSRLIHFVLNRRYRKMTLPFYVLANFFRRKDYPQQADSNNYVIEQMANVDAAIGLVQLSKFDQIVQKRIRYAEYLTDRLEKWEFITPPPFPIKGSIYTKYIVQLRRAEFREPLMRFLHSKGIEVQETYTPLHLHEMRNYSRGPLPVTEKLWDKLLPLSNEPSMSFNELDYLVNALYSFRGNSGK